MIALDGEMFARAWDVSDDAHRQLWTAEAAAELAAYRAGMAPDALTRARTAALQRLCREALALPVLAFTPS